MKRFMLVLSMISFLMFSLCDCIHADSLQKVTINGKTLDKINDIVMEVTGTRTIVKKSFLKFRKDSDGGFKFIISWSSADLGGSNVTLYQSESYETGHAAGKTNTGIHPVVGKKRTSDGKLVVVFPSTISNNTEKLFINSIKISGNAEDHSITNEGYRYHSIVDLTNFYISDSASGLFPTNNGDREVFAITYFVAKGGKRPGYYQNYDAYLCLFDPEADKWKTYSLGNDIKALFPSVRVVAGDFDNDTQANELAIITDGGNADYWIRVFRVSGLELGNPIYSESLGKRESTEADNSDGCDVVAGDFNHDGKTEFAAVYANFIDSSKTANPGGDYYPTVTTFKWNGSGFTQQSETDKNGDLELGSTHWTKSSYVPHFGLIAEAEDIDGDGRDDIVFLTASYGGGEGNIVVSVWDTNDSLKPYKKCHKKTSKKIAGYGGTTGAAIAECSYLPRSLSLGLVPVGDKSDGKNTCRIFVTKSQGGDSVKNSSDYRNGDEIFEMKVNNSNGSVSSLTDLTLWKSGSKGYATAIVPADFYTECVELGDPVRMVYSADRSYAAEIQTPPYHVDYVKPDFEVNGSVPAGKMILNMSYMGSSVTYKTTSADSGKSDVAFNSTSTLDFGVTANASLNIKKLVTVKASGGYNDTSTRVENAANTNEVKTTLTIKDTYKGTDSLILYEANRYVWRYPVLSYTDKPDNKDLNGDVFMTFSMCDAPVITHGVSGQSYQFDDYQPIHEEGNLFSYPTKIQNIPYYSSRQADLTQETGTNIGSKTEGVSEITLSLSTATSDVSGLTTKSKKAINGSLTLVVGAPKVTGASTSATASYARELTNTDTFTKTYSESDEFIVTINNNPLPFSSSYIQHKIMSQLYSDAAGVMKVGFAVDLKSAGENALVWRSTGMYGTKPDIALVLPARFDRTTSTQYNNTLIKWTANGDRISATQIRGIHFIDEDGNYTTASLVKGKKYTVQIPVYNASFKAPDEPVEIEMRLRRIISNDETLDTDYGRLDIQTFSIGGWVQDTENNKATVSFNCEIPTTITQGNYDLYFVIDPEDSIDELHEDWNSKTDPAGNNVGRYPIAVLNNEPPAYSTAYGASVNAASVSENDFRILFEPVRNDDTRTELTFDEFRKEAVSQPEEFRAFARVVYSGNEILTNQYMNVTRINSEGTLERIAFRTIPAIFPNSERNVSFMVSPELLRNSTFNVDIVGDGTNLHWQSEPGSDPDPEPDPEPTPTPTPTPHNPGSSSGGCDSGISSLIVLAVSAVFALRRKKF